jgi:DNA-binding SARP family transcriptional activator/tetratricopeptide (TPR) repeat protein
MSDAMPTGSNEDQQLHVDVLGPVRALVGGREVPLGSARPRAVFAVLALRSERVVPRDDIIDGVWGDRVPATAVGSLHTYISALRTSLNPDRGRGAKSCLLTSSRAGYWLHLDPRRLDAVGFAALREQGLAALASGDPVCAVQTLDAALAFWRGDALSGLPGPYAEGQRVRLGELHVATRELRAQAALAAGLHADVIGDLTTLVSEHPLREEPRVLLMLALHRCGRSSEALEKYREARHAWVTELGLDPGPALRSLHDRILADDPGLRAPEPSVAAVGPTPRAARRSRPLEALAGRESELIAVEGLLNGIAAGRGGLLWVEGEMGIGKSMVVASCLARAERAGFQVAHAVGDELRQPLPLAVMLECLGIGADTEDPSRARIWAGLRENPGRSVLDGGDPVVGAVDRMVALVEQQCAAGPTVVALDDLHWADIASILTWHRLTVVTERFPLLLIGATRPVPHRVEIDRLRGDVERRSGRVLRLEPLTTSAVDDMLGELLGAPPGPGLRQVATQASGNPLYVREIAEALLRARALQIADGRADVPVDFVTHAPSSLINAVSGRLGYLSETTRDVLRWATLLSSDFTVAQLSVVVDRPVRDLVVAVNEAFAAGVLRDGGTVLGFRHPVIRQALYESVAGALRVAMHHQAARALADSGAPVEHVAEQLLAAQGDSEPWVVDWLISQAAGLTFRAPLVAVELLRRIVAAGGAGEERRTALRAQLSGVLFRIGRDVEAAEHARRALPVLRDANLAAQLRWILAYVPYRASRADEALAALSEALDDPHLPPVWRARLMSLLALVQRAGIGDSSAAARPAGAAVALGEQAGDRFAVGQALEVLWQVDAVRRDYAAAVRHLDRAMAIVDGDLSLTDLELVLLDNRMFTLQCLDRLDDASADLRRARGVGGRGAPAAGVHVAAAVHAFWLGHWDEALAELSGLQDCPDFTGFGLREGGPLLLLHGVAALICVHCDNDGVRRHLQAGMNLPLVTAADRENCDFLVAAEAMEAARGGDPAGAAAMLSALLNGGDVQMMLRHQWFPWLVRLALETGDTSTAHAAVLACEAEAMQETTRARAAASARRCRALLQVDPDALSAVVDHYRTVGRSFELAETLEDQARLLRQRGRDVEASAVLGEAVVLYQRMGASWNIRRSSVHSTTPAIPDPARH